MKCDACKAVLSNVLALMNILDTDSVLTLRHWLVLMRVASRPHGVLNRSSAGCCFSDFLSECMTGPIKSEPRGNEKLRAIAFVSAGLLVLHAAAFPIYWGYGSLMILGVPDDYINLGSLLTFTTIISLAAFCLSTQFYLQSKRQ